MPSVAVDKDIHLNIGTPKNSLLIEVQLENKEKRVMKIKKLGAFEVQVTEYKALNQYRGTMVIRTISNSAIEEPIEVLADQKLVNIERMKFRKKSKLIETDSYNCL